MAVPFTVVSTSKSLREAEVGDRALGLRTEEAEGEQHQPVSGG